ncbi:MAG: AIM24 family protein [Clostridium sp.]|nr:AIM24 family protein [Clostridium sp.]MCM1399845.1 AIM24 family protein [Clostridium sp.]MCM1460670.1 AIM24 family protein [Bacteroides sp.]
MVYQSYLNNQNIVVTSSLGGMQVLQYARDMSVSAAASRMEYYCAQMNVNRKQLLLNLNGNGYTIQAGAMQWMSGNVQMTTGVKGVGDFFGKFVSSKVTGETTIKPVYVGEGQMMLEPTYRHILLIDVSQWNGGVVLDDGLFLACDNTVGQKVVARSNVSSAVLGGEGLFNLSLQGAGYAALESIVPMEEIIEIDLQNDVMKIDGNMAIAWSGSLEFTVEKSGKSLIGSAVSGEGLVNVYRGTGKIWMAPVTTMRAGAGKTDFTENASAGRTGSKAGKLDVASGIMELFS